MRKGVFITLEGGEGCGKTTQLEFLKSFVEKQKVEYIFTREPGGCPVCEEMRQILLHSKENICSEAEFLLFSASRAQLCNEVIVPALEEGKLVIADRFYDSSIAYQGNARGLGIDNVLKITNFAIGDLKPDLTIFLKLDPELSFKRKGGVDTTDRIECAGLEFHKKVAEGYGKAIELEPDRFLVVDASKTIEEIQEEIKNALVTKFPNMFKK